MSAKVQSSPTPLSGPKSHRRAAPSVDDAQVSPLAATRARSRRARARDRFGGLDARPPPSSDAILSNPTAQGAFGGSVLTGWLDPTTPVQAQRDGFRPRADHAADPFEKAWAARLDRDGNAVVLTVRKHKPFQRVRATFVAADGTRSATRTISDHTAFVGRPQLSVAPDGTAVAAWSWHDAAGRRAQAAIRRPGQAPSTRRRRSPRPRR